MHDLHLLELLTETLRAILADLATVVPDWLRRITQPVGFERYGRRVEAYRLPKSQEKREALARHGTPVIFNTDQGSQFTSVAFIGLLSGNSIAISMNGRGA